MKPEISGLSKVAKERRESLLRCYFASKQNDQRSFWGKMAKMLASENDTG